MGTLLYSMQALEDLHSAVEFIARDSEVAANTWLDEFLSRAELLADHPDLGERVVSRRLGELRRHSVGRYLIYYSARPSEVIVLRVMHGARSAEV